MNNHIAHEHHHDTSDKDMYGFWIYILSDCILFASLFATYAVLFTSTYGGPGMKELTKLPYVLTETFLLLFSSFTYGLAILSVYQNKIKQVTTWLMITFLLGASFVVMEVNEFWHLYLEGHTWQNSAALSAFFTLVGTHGLHVSLGLIWMLVMIVQLNIFGLTPVIKKRLNYLALFWAFLDIIWIFVYTIVYLIGVV